MPELANRLRSEARRMTGPRQAILELLRKHRHPLSIKEIHAQLPEGCDLATVYRALHLLEDMRVVKRFDLGDHVARFELLADGDDGHHHHLICTRCAGVTEVDGCGIEVIQQKIAEQSGFKTVTHKLEFFGICPSCQ